MSTEVLLYWITRLDSIHKVVTVGIVLAAIMCASGVFFWITSYSDDDGMCEVASRVVKKSAIPLFLFIAAKVFIPTTRDALIIAGVGGTIEYLKSNETATQLPDKAIKALDKLVDEYLEGEFADESVIDSKKVRNRN